MLRLEITYPILRRLVLNAIEGLADFSVERIGNETAIVKMKHGSFPFSFSIRVDVLSLQRSSDDPVVLKIGVPAFLLNVLKEYMKHEGIEISGGEMRIHPQKLTKVLRGVRLSNLIFGEDRIVLVLEGEQPS